MAAPPRVLFCIVDVAGLENGRGGDPFGGAYGVLRALRRARAALPADGRWGFQLFSSQARRRRRRRCVPSR